MKWEKVKSLYKNQWVIIEAIEAHSKNSERILDEISVVDVTGDDSRKALEIYKKLHRENKDRELYVIHTSRDNLDIKEKICIGVRR